jgi:hypothetical protein
LNSNFSEQIVSGEFVNDLSSMFWLITNSFSKTKYLLPLLMTHWRRLRPSPIHILWWCVELFVRCVIGEIHLKFFKTCLVGEIECLSSTIIKNLLNELCLHMRPDYVLKKWRALLFKVVVWNKSVPLKVNVFV